MVLLHPLHSIPIPIPKQTIQWRNSADSLWQSIAPQKRTFILLHEKLAKYGKENRLAEKIENFFAMIFSIQQEKKYNRHFSEVFLLFFLN